MTERIALPPPILQDPVERILLEQHADASVLFVHVAALEEPAIDVLPHVRARPARQLVQGLLRRQTLVIVPEPAEIAASLLIGEPPQKGLPVRVVAVR